MAAELAAALAHYGLQRTERVRNGPEIRFIGSEGNLKETVQNFAAVMIKGKTILDKEINSVAVGNQ